MPKNKTHFNSNGLTLIEILAAMTILSIVVIGFLSFFSQSMVWSQKAGDHLSASTVVDRIIYKVKQNVTPPDFILEENGCTTLSGDIIGLHPDSAGKYYYEVNDTNYYPVITICQTVDEKKVDLNLYRMHVEIYDDNPDHGTLLTEMYDYLEKE